MVDACRVVVPTASGVGEGKVGVVYELEFAGSFGALWGIGRHAVGVGFECCSGEVLVVVVYERGRNMYRL